MLRTYTIISFGNYETKIVVCNYINKKVFPIYVKSFITKHCFENSIVIDVDMLAKKLKSEIKNIPIDISQTKIIFNLPIKEFEIKDNWKEFIVNDILTQNKWNEISSRSMVNKSTDKMIQLTSKCHYIKVDSQIYLRPPINKKIEKLTFYSKHYLVDKKYINAFVEVKNKLRLNVDLYTCDSLVMNNLFINLEKTKKLLVNIGHGETIFEFYDNSILCSQFSCGFGIKQLTSEICQKANIDEIMSIELLKIYKDLVTIDNSLTLVNNFKETFLKYSKITIDDISVMIKKWMKMFIRQLNNQIAKHIQKQIKIDEIYIYSSTNFFNSWTEHIKNELIEESDVICLESKYIGIKESKYISLIATMMFFDTHYKDNK